MKTGLFQLVDQFLVSSNSGGQQVQACLPLLTDPFLEIIVGHVRLDRLLQFFFLLPFFFRHVAIALAKMLPRHQCLSAVGKKVQEVLQMDMGLVVVLHLYQK